MNRKPNETTLTPADLAGWKEPGTHLAVIGNPVRHSLSPPMHNAALERMAVVDPRFKLWRYWKIEAPVETLEATLGTLHGLGFAGINLTIPHKQIAVGFVSTIDPAAARMGAVNTLRHTPAG
jgi:shikimate dehydrogenase